MLDTTFPPMPEHVAEIQSRHYRLMEQIRRSADAGNITPSQAIMIMSLGTENIKASDLIRRGHYAGTNASYNISVLEDAGYIRRENVPGDKRQKLVALTDKGLDLCIRLRRMLAREKADG